MSTDLARMITKVLPISLGGTGATEALAGFNALAAGLSAASGEFNDNTFFITTNNSGATNDYYRRSYSILKGNIKTYLTPNIITSIVYSGSGNAITALSLSSAGILTATKGTTFLTNISTSDSTKFYRGDKTWSNTLTGPLYIGTNTNRFMLPCGLRRWHNSE